MLFVSIAFPPKNDPECVQSGRFAFYLRKEFGWDIKVVTSKTPTLFMPYDKSLERLSKGFNKIEIPIYESKIANKLISLFCPSLLNQPDSKFSFYLQWRRVVKKSQKPSIIYSRSFPLSSCLMALKIKEYYQVPWIMHLSDPWVESPLHNMKTKFHEKKELKCFETADAISFTTKEALLLYSKKYPALKEKFFVNTNAFENLREDNKCENLISGKLKIVYTGGLANTRTPIVFLNSLKKIVNNDASINDVFHVTFAGDLDSKNKNLFKEYENLKCLNHIGILSQQESIKLQSSANILLVIDSKISEVDKNVFLPSKLIDYAISQKHIIAITEKNSPTYKFVNEFGGNAFTFEEEELLTNYLTELSKNPSLINRGTKIPKYYSIENQVTRLNTKLSSLLNN